MQFWSQIFWFKYVLTIHSTEKCFHYAPLYIVSNYFDWTSNANNCIELSFNEQIRPSLNRTFHFNLYQIKNILSLLYNSESQSCGRATLSGWKRSHRIEENERAQKIIPLITDKVNYYKFHNGYVIDIQSFVNEVRILILFLFFYNIFILYY